jgi:cell division protein FtsL
MLRRVVWQKLTDISEVRIALVVEAVNTSETSVNFYHTTRRTIPGNNHLHTRLRENLKSHRLFSCLYIMILLCILMKTHDCNDFLKFLRLP